MSDAAFIDALVHYRTEFPTLESLGTGNPPKAWHAALVDATPGAFDAVLVTSAGSEGGTSSGSRQFPQMVKVRALHALRAERDSSYTNPYSVEITNPMPRRRLGFVVRL